MKSAEMAGSILLLSKKDVWSVQAGALAKATFGDALLWEQGTVGDAAPASFSQSEFMAVISFLSPWIIPAHVLNASKLSINFHPGSCNYPGIGCYNFALYEEAAKFGPVCHHMLPAVDTGEVIREDLFPLFSRDSVETLKLRTMVVMLAMFHDIIVMMAEGKALPVNSRQWSRKAFTRKQLNALCEITPDMNDEEKRRRIRAMTYPGYPGPYLLVGSEKQYYPVPPGPPLA